MNGRESVELCHSLRPELILMDVHMPQMNGLEATRVIKREAPHTAILILTAYEDHTYLLEALKAGASGYVLKDASQQQLIEAIWRVLGGEVSLNNEFATRMLLHLAEEVQVNGSLDDDSAPSKSRLSERLRI